MPSNNGVLRKIVKGVGQAVKNPAKTGIQVGKDFVKGLKDYGAGVRETGKLGARGVGKLQKAIRKVLPTTKGVDKQVIDERVNPATGKPYVPPVKTPSVENRPFRKLPKIPDAGEGRRAKQRYNASPILES